MGEIKTFKPVATRNHERAAYKAKAIAYLKTAIERLEDPDDECCCVFVALSGQVAGTAQGWSDVANAQALLASITIGWNRFMRKSWDLDSMSLGDDASAIEPPPDDQPA